MKKLVLLLCAVFMLSGCHSIGQLATDYQKSQYVQKKTDSSDLIDPKYRYADQHRDFGPSYTGPTDLSGNTTTYVLDGISYKCHKSESSPYTENCTSD